MSKPGQISEFCKQASQVGLRVNIFGREDLATRAEIDQVPASLEGAVFPGNHVSDDFFAAYVTQHQDDSHIAQAAYSYEFARLLPLLLKELDSKPATNQAIISGLTKMRIAEGAKLSIAFALLGLGRCVTHSPKTQKVRFPSPKRISGYRAAISALSSKTKHSITWHFSPHLFKKSLNATLHRSPKTIVR